MQIDKTHRVFFEDMLAGTHCTLSEARTNLPVLVVNSSCMKVKVDNGIMSETGVGRRKCDYLFFRETEKTTKLIELKGSIIDHAYSQLIHTIEGLTHHEQYSEMVTARQKLEAYIVSPNRQRVPRANDRAALHLAKLMAGRSIERLSTTMHLIQYVRVVSKSDNMAQGSNTVYCSGRSPLEI